VDGHGGAIVVIVVRSGVNVGVTVVVLCSSSRLSSWGAVELAVGSTLCMLESLGVAGGE